MTRLTRLKGGLALLILVLISPNSASKEDACSPSCRGLSRPGGFRYQEGTTYKYKFQSAIQVSVTDKHGVPTSKTAVQGTVFLSPLSPCSHSLKIEDIEVFSSNTPTKFRNIDGISLPVQFHFHDGVLGDHICANPDDKHNSLNIKRAIISMFQVDMQHEHETDVFGVCPTETSSSSDRGDTIILKERDLDECGFRETIKEDFMVSSFDPESTFKTSPMLTGEYNSRQKIKDGILNEAFIFENYTYLAFTDVDDKDELGAKARVITTLHFLETSRAYAPPVRGGEAKSIIFDNPHPITAERINMDSIIAAIKKLKREEGMVVTEHAARDFLDLVKILRSSNKDDMLIAFRQVKAGAGFRDRVGARKVFLDALFRCGTGNAIVVGVELLKGRELSPAEEKLVYLSFAFVKHATLSALESASSLLDTHQLPREAYLGIGNLAGRYCREHQCDVEAVRRLTQRLSAKLGYGRVYTRDEENEIIFVLKALANIHHLDEGVLAKVTGLVQDKESPTRLRVAALETYLSDACHESVRNGALHVLKDIQEDSELRIKAYLVLAKCPNAHAARSIKSVLEHEPSYQVGGFMVSHLRNLKASANPDRAAARHVLGEIGTNKNFPIDPRKYSFNGEFSYDLDALGMSSSVEANVIYSQNSFLPRSTNLNLTAELFGHTINFLEIGTRQQNLDRLLEHYFGPMGVFNQATPEDLKQSSLHSFQRIVAHFNKRFERSRGRGKRDVSKSEIDSFGRQLQIRTNELNNELDLDLSIKLFGSELFFLSLSDDTENLSPEDIIDRFFDAYEQDLTRSRNFDHTYQTNTIFLDTEFSYPTSMGFPLRLGIEGTSAIQVKTKGDIDVGALLDETSNAGIFKLSLIPSASIEVAASIALDAQVFENGLKVVSNLYTATGGDLEVNMQDRNRGMEAKFSLPLQNQKIVSATHEVVLKTREIGKPEILTPITFAQNKDFNVCFNDLSPYFGVNLCMDINSPPTNTEESPLLAGNYKFALSLDNEDFSHFQYKEVYHNDARTLGGEVTAEVMGKRQNKKLGLHLQAYYAPDTYLKASYVAPSTSGSAELKLISTYQEFSVSLVLEQDRQRYTGKAGALITSVPSGTRWTPILEFAEPGGYGRQRLPLSVQGSFVVESRHTDTKIIFENLKLNLDLEDYPGRGNSYGIDGNVGHVGHDYFSDLTISGGPSRESIQIVGKYSVQRNVIHLDGQIKQSHAPESNVHLIYEFKRHPTEIDSVFQLIHGPDPNSQRNRITISDSLIYKRINDYDYEVQTKNKMSYPLANFDAQFDYTATPKSLFYDVEVKYGRFIVGSELDLKYSVRAEGDYDLDFQIYDADDEVELKAKLDIQGDLYRTDNTFVINGAKYELAGTVTYREDHDEVNSNADLLLHMPDVREPLQIHEEWNIKAQHVRFILKINDRYEQYADISILDSEDNSNGNVKINIPHMLALSAHGRETRGVGNGEFTLDIAKSASVKADTAFTFTDPTYNVRLTLYPEFNKDRGNYLSITTNNQIKKNSILSKNTIDASGSKIQLNGAFSEEDKDTKGQILGEVDVTMPDGDFGAIKYNYNYDAVHEKLNSEQSLTIEARGLYDWRNAKISAKEILKNVDSDGETYDYTYMLDSDDGEGRASHIKVNSKRDLQGDKVAEEALIKIHGNRENDGLEAKAAAVYDDYSGTYDVFASYDGGYYLLDVDGKFDFTGLSENEGPISEEITIQLKTPNPDLQDMKLSAALSVPETDFWEKYLTLKGSVEFALNEHQRSRYTNSMNGKADLLLKLGDENGEVKVTLSSLSTDPITLTGKYDFEEVGNGVVFKGNAGIQYERYKNMRSDLTIELPSEHEVKIDFGLESPQSAPTRIQVHAKESENAQVFKGEVVITTNNQRYVLVEDLDLRDESPGFNVQLTYPRGQIDQVLAKLKIGRATLEGDVKVHFHEHNFALDSHLEARIDTEEDFSVKFTANCPSLEILNLIVDIQNRPLNGPPQNILDNRFGESHPAQPTREDPRYTTPDPRYTTPDPRYTTPDPRYNRDPYHSYDSRYPTEDPRHRQDPYRNHDSRSPSEDPRYGKDPYHNYDSRSPAEDLRSRQDPYQNHDSRSPTEDSRSRQDPYHNYDSRYPAEDSRSRQDPYQNHDSRSPAEDPRSRQDPYQNHDSRSPAEDPRSRQDPYQNHDSRSPTEDPRYRQDPYRDHDSRYDNRDSAHNGNHDSRYNNRNDRDSRYNSPDDRYRNHQDYRGKRSVDRRYGDHTYGGGGYGDAYNRDPSYRNPKHEPQTAGPKSHGESLQVSIQHAGRNVLSGSASYAIHTQGETVTIEGAGSLRIKEERPRQHTYQVVRRTIFSARESGEGVEYTWKLDANEETISGKLTITDQDFNFVSNNCERRTDCLRVEINSRVLIYGIDNFEIDQGIAFDLHRLGLPKLGLRETIKYQGSIFDASGQMYFDERNRYQYKLYGDDKSFEASATTPLRVVSLEGKLQGYGGYRPGPSNFQIDFYLDKHRQPHQKSSIKGVVDCRGGNDIGKCNVELKFTNPALRKDLALIYTSNYNYPQTKAEYNLIIDIFNNPNNKIVCTGKLDMRRIGGGGVSGVNLYEIKSQGLDIDIKYEETLVYDLQYARELKYNYLVRYHVGRATYDSAVTAKYSPEHFLFLVKVLNREVINIDAKVSTRGGTVTGVTQVRAMGSSPSTINFDVSETSLMCSISRLNTPSERLELKANLLEGTLLDINLKYYERNRPYNLLTAYIRVNNRDELESLYEYDKQNIQRLIIQPTKAEYANMKRELAYIKEDAKKDLNTQLQKVDEIAKWDLPDFRPITQYYQTELSKIDRELESDRALMSFWRFIDLYLGPILERLEEMLVRIDEISASSKASMEEQYQTFLHKLEREIKPWLTENADKLANAAAGSWEAAERLVFAIVDEFVEFVSKHDRAIKGVGNLVIGTLEDTIIFVVKMKREIEKEIRQELEKLYKELKSIAIFDELDNKLKQALDGKPVPESYIRDFREAVNNMKDSTNSPVLKKFITVVADYIEKKLKQQPIDDSAAIQSIIMAGFDVLVEIYHAIDGDGDDEDGLAVSWEAIYAIPKLIEAELSPVTYFLYGDLPDLEELFDSPSLDLKDFNIPEDMDAFVAQGQHIFTFDGKYMFFPGSCEYIFARDTINGNFTIVGGYHNGELVSITFVDKHDSVTIKKDGHLLLNQAAAEYPIRRQHRLEVYRNYETVNIWSTTGVSITCGLDLLVCSFHVSGYYHAQLRGLLGNGNNEPYDDFTLPNGMIITNEAEFGNSYKIGRYCTDISPMSNPGHQRNPICSRLFNSASPLSICFNFVDPVMFRKACDRGTTAGVRDTERAIAFAYVAACTTKGLHVEVPPHFVKCHNHDIPMQVEQEFAVTTPTKSADIVIVADQDKINEHIFRDLIQPLTTDLTNTLSREGISDVEFHLVGYGGAYEKQPAHYTVDGKFTFKGGRTPNLHFSNPPKESARETFMEYINRLSDEVELLTGQDMVSEAYLEGAQYPFRANALKSIIMLNGKPCDEAQFELVQSLSSLFALNNQLTVNLFTPFKGIDPRNPTSSNIIGFDKNTVYTFSNPAGSKQRNAIDNNNFCVEFALMNRGNVFVVNNFVQGRSKQQFIQVAAQTIAKELTSVEQWLDCKCEMFTAYSAQNVCTIRYSRPRQTARPPPRRRQHG